MRVVSLVLFLLFAAYPAQAQIRITNDPGGQIGAYIQQFNYIKTSGHRVVIDGLCASACTLIMRYIPRERVCITGRAVFGFHAAYNGVMGHYVSHSQEGTNFLMKSYPPIVRRWIIRNGGLKPAVKLMPGSALGGYYKRC